MVERTEAPMLATSPTFEAAARAHESVQWTQRAIGKTRPLILAEVALVLVLDAAGIRPYHVDASTWRARVQEHGSYAHVHISRSCSTYDFNTITAFVLAAHHYGVRVEVRAEAEYSREDRHGEWVRCKEHSKGATYSGIASVLHVSTRGCRDGGHVWDRHPTLSAVSVPLVAYPEEVAAVQEVSRG